MDPSPSLNRDDKVNFNFSKAPTPAQLEEAKAEEKKLREEYESLPDLSFRKVLVELKLLYVHLTLAIMNLGKKMDQNKAASLRKEQEDLKNVIDNVERAIHS